MYAGHLRLPCFFVQYLRLGVETDSKMLTVGKRINTVDIFNSIRDALLEAQDLLNRFTQNPENIATIAKTAEMMQDVFERQGRIFTCGNGGSLCDAIHFAEECTGKFRDNRRPLPAIALSDAGHITCTANDFGFKEIFARPLSALGHPGDLLIVLSTSGNSENVIRAAETAKQRGIQVFGLPVGMAVHSNTTAIFTSLPPAILQTASKKSTLRYCTS